MRRPGYSPLPAESIDSFFIAPKTLNSFAKFGTGGICVPILEIGVSGAHALRPAQANNQTAVDFRRTVARGPFTTRSTGPESPKIRSARRKPRPIALTSPTFRSIPARVNRPSGSSFGRFPAVLPSLAFTFQTVPIKSGWHRRNPQRGSERRYGIRTARRKLDGRDALCLDRWTVRRWVCEPIRSPT